MHCRYAEPKTWEEGWNIANIVAMNKSSITVAGTFTVQSAETLTVKDGSLNVKQIFCLSAICIWKPSKGDGSFLFPVDQLSSVFRAKMVEALRSYVKTEKIKTAAGLFNSLFEKKWVVYAKPLFA